MVAEVYIVSENGGAMASQTSVTLPIDEASYHKRHEPSNITIYIYVYIYIHTHTHTQKTLPYQYVPGYRTF